MLFPFALVAGWQTHLLLRAERLACTAKARQLSREVSGQITSTAGSHSCHLLLGGPAALHRCAGVQDLHDVFYCTGSYLLYELLPGVVLEQMDNLAAGAESSPPAASWSEAIPQAFRKGAASCHSTDVVIRCWD